MLPVDSSKNCRRRHGSNMLVDADSARGLREGDVLGWLLVEVAGDVIAALVARPGGGVAGLRAVLATAASDASRNGPIRRALPEPREADLAVDPGGIARRWPRSASVALGGRTHPRTAFNVRAFSSARARGSASCARRCKTLSRATSHQPPVNEAGFALLVELAQLRLGNASAASRGSNSRSSSRWTMRRPLTCVVWRRRPRWRAVRGAHGQQLEGRIRSSSAAPASCRERASAPRPPSQRWAGHRPEPPRPSGPGASLGAGAAGRSQAADGTARTEAAPPHPDSSHLAPDPPPRRSILARTADRDRVTVSLRA